MNTTHPQAQQMNSLLHSFQNSCESAAPYYDVIVSGETASFGELDRPAAKNKQADFTQRVSRKILSSKTVFDR